MEFVFDSYNWWSIPIYRNKNGTPICKVDGGFYTLADNEDIDSEPYRKLKKDFVEIVEKFS